MHVGVSWGIEPRDNAENAFKFSTPICFHNHKTSYALKKYYTLELCSKVNDTIYPISFMRRPLQSLVYGLKTKFHYKLFTQESAQDLANFLEIEII